MAYTDITTLSNYEDWVSYNAIYKSSKVTSSNFKVTPDKSL